MGTGPLATSAVPAHARRCPSAHAHPKPSATPIQNVPLLRRLYSKGAVLNIIKSQSDAIYFKYEGSGLTHVLASVKQTHDYKTSDIGTQVAHLICLLISLCYVALRDCPAREILSLCALGMGAGQIWKLVHVPADTRVGGAVWGGAGVGHSWVAKRWG